MNFDRPPIKIINISNNAHDNYVFNQQSVAQHAFETGFLNFETCRELVWNWFFLETVIGFFGNGKQSFKNSITSEKHLNKRIKHNKYENSKK